MFKFETVEKPLISLTEFFSTLNFITIDMIDKILFITLSNIGDCILTLPALDLLAASFPQAKITVMAGPRARQIFEHNPRVNRLIIYNKKSTLGENFKLFLELKKEKFAMVVDLRNTLFGVALPAQLKTSPFLSAPRNIPHMKNRHLDRLQRVAKGCKGLQRVAEKQFFCAGPRDEDYIDGLLLKHNITHSERIIVVAPGARSHIKRWPQDRFAQLIPLLENEFSARVILAGDKDDSAVAKYICAHCSCPVIDLCGETSLAQLAQLLNRAACVVTNDSAVLHLSSYLNRPTAAIFGPTSEEKYGPWPEAGAVAKKELACRPCEKAQCRLGTLNCLNFIKPEDVLRQVRTVLSPKTEKPLPAGRQGEPKTQLALKRILIVRTDRIGDVLLSTPVIKALREAYPFAYIAMMVSPYAKDIVEGNPYLDEVIIYNKEGKHHSWRRSWKFARNLKKKKFDLALVLHPTNRVHLVTFLAAIPRRIGYDRKLGFLLTERFEHKKQRGEKHELEYNLDLVRHLGIQPQDKNLFMPLKEDAEKWAEEFLREQGIKAGDKLLAIHPGASCPSKIWPPERFAEAADKLSRKFGFKVLIIAGPKDIEKVKAVAEKMLTPAVNLAGRTSVAQLASLLKRCCLFISNDSGPVHIASAVGVPVISIFGRNQKGLSPLRWGPVGEKDKALHKEVGCIVCLAHNCLKEFACLKAICVDDVIKAAEEIMRSEK